MREALIEKLRPDRFTAMSGKMAAIVGYILDERFSDPAISELVVTSDGFVLAQTEGEVGANDMIGEEADLNRNLLSLIEAAGLSEDEIRDSAAFSASAFGATEQGDDRSGKAAELLSKRNNRRQAQSTASKVRCTRTSPGAR